MNINPRHISYLYSRVIFNDRNQIINYINQQTLVLENQRINNVVEIRQLVLLGDSWFELKSVEGFRKSMDYYKEAMDLIYLTTPYSTKQIDYAYVLACHAVSYHSHEFYLDGKRQNSRFSKSSLREPKEIYDQIEISLSILNEIQYNGPQVGIIINMYAKCILSSGKISCMMQYEIEDIEYLKALVTQGLINLKNNGLPDLNSDIADSYCMLASLHVMPKDKKIAKSYFMKALEIYSIIYSNIPNHPKIAFTYCRILTTLLDIKDQNLGLKAISMKRQYYGTNHFEVIDPLNSTYICLLKNNSYNLTIENDLNSTQKANGLKSNSEKLWGDPKCCQIL